MRSGQVNDKSERAARRADQIPEPLWTIDDVAAYLRVSRATVRRWTNAGLLPCYRLGGNRERRFAPEAVLAFVARQTQDLAAGPHVERSDGADGIEPSLSGL